MDFTSAASASSRLAISEGCCLSYYSDEGRGFPDVAARGDRFRVAVGGKVYHVDGTSASSPVRHRIRKTDLFLHLTDVICPALDCRRISLALKRLQDLARPSSARVPQPIFVF